MPGNIRLTIKEAKDLAEQIEGKRGDATSLRTAINDTGDPRNKHSSVPASSATDEEYLEEMRSKSSIEYGADLECIMCHDKFDHLLCGTCENCWREWMLSTKPKYTTKRLV